MTYTIGFYGAGDINAYGNTWLRQFWDRVGVDHRYVQNDVLTAEKDFLAFLDKDGDMIINPEDIVGLTVKVCGYSWGGVSAIGFTQDFSTAPKYIVVGGTPHDPIQYRLNVIIPFDILLTIDPVPLLNPPGTVYSNVDSYVNYYQQRGGYSLFRLVSDPTQGKQIGNSFSALLKGTNVFSQAGQTTQTRVDLGGFGSRVGTPFDIDNPPDFTEYSLADTETNHDGMPWLVADDAAAKF